MVTPLSSGQITERLDALSGWDLGEDATFIEKRFKFATFTEAFAFMTRAALDAEKMDHHPDWRNVYNTVEVRLSTHDAGGLTQRDFDLAVKMDAAAGARSDNPYDV